MLEPGATEFRDLADSELRDPEVLVLVPPSHWWCWCRHHRYCWCWCRQCAAAAGAGAAATTAAGAVAAATTMLEVSEIGERKGVASRQTRSEGSGRSAKNAKSKKREIQHQSCDTHPVSTNQPREAITELSAKEGTRVTSLVNFLRTKLPNESKAMQEN